MLKKISLFIAPALVFVGCAQAPVQQKPVQTKPTPVIVVKPQPPKVTPPNPQPVPNATYNSFSEWKSDFTKRAIAEGHNAYDVQRLMDTVSLNSQAISLDSRQPEFAKMPWDYADSAVSSGRVSTGKGKFAEQRSLLTRLESQYGVEAEIIAAIWGMESSYGAVTGSSYIPSSLASLAYDGRRRGFAEDQLLSLLTLLQRGDVYPSQLNGSWAGGMGQTQFIPATWLTEGVDGNGDGRRSPWTTEDALSSTANYLSNSGWVRGLEPFYEVTLPPSLDFSYVNTKQPAAQWRAMGVTPINGIHIDDGTPLELWLPAGKDGPALLLSPNFDVIKVYNNSSNYALGVSLLGRAISGQRGIQKSWPRYEQPLSTVQVKTLQQRLTSAGYNTNGIDGILGSNTRRAFARWQADNGQTPDGFITQRSASSLVW